MNHASTLHPTVLAKIGEEEVRVMFDSGAGSSYLCTDVITKLNLKPARKEQRCIEQMYGTMRKIVEVYSVTVHSLAVEGFSIDVECINAEKDVLTHLPNPNIKALKKQCGRFRRLTFTEEATRSDTMPVHVILGAADYQRIRTTEPLILGVDPDKDPGAEFTMLGWTVYGSRPVTEGVTAEKQFLLRTGQEEFEKLCSLDVLGLKDTRTTKNKNLHEDFLHQLNKTQGGFYETRLQWKEDHVPLPTNKNLSVARLNSTTRKLERMSKLQDYDQIMQEQVAAGIMEPVPPHQRGEAVHYIPHQAVIREQAETTKMRIVYDCSSRANTQTPSLNDCLETGPPLQPLLFDILLRNRIRKHCVTGNIQKAFLQIRVHEQDRDAQRVLWYDNLTDRNIAEYRFTRVIFGATSSPYILGATLQKHIKGYDEAFKATAQALLEDTYVDDIQGGGDVEEDAATFKEEASNIMSEGGFTLHKWHSNVEQLNSVEKVTEGEETYAKSLVGNRGNKETKILGTLWNKAHDTLSIDFKTCLKENKPLTKRKMISTINSIYDVLGWASPVTITAKLLFSEVCLLKLHWDTEVPAEIQREWKSWRDSLQRAPTLTVPRCVFKHNRTHFEIHGFADASKVAVCAALYIVSYQDSTPVDQNLLAAKSRVAPKEMSIPRLELVAAHTLAKLENNVSRALASFPITAYHNWVDSITVLCWLANRGEWTTFVRNRVKVIGELTESGTWRYVPTTENPSDLGTRGSAPNKLKEFWLRGPSWLSDESARPEQPAILETDEAKAERHKKETMLLAEDKAHGAVKDWAEGLLNKFPYWKLLRITAYVNRFIDGYKKSRRVGPITKSEIGKAEKKWIQITQETCNMKTDIRLAKDEDGLIRCNERIQGYTPIFIPRESVLARRIIEHYHVQTLHGGVAATMNKVRQRYWVPRLRSLVKSVRRSCNYCKKYRVTVLNAPPTSALPKFRTEFTEPFNVTGVDFAGPLLYKSGSETGKAYVALFTCASTRAVHLKLCKDMTAEEFKRGLKEFVVRRGAPDLIVSDNAKTFQAMKKWLSTLQKDENLFNYLATKEIGWKFNMSRAPWWGGFFERLIGIMKNALSKAIGRALLRFEELEEILLDVESFLNNRPLCYMGEEFETPVITPNLLLRGQPAPYLEENRDEMSDREEMTRRLRYLKTCRDNVRKRWLNEYLHALQERFNSRPEARHGTTCMEKGSLVLIKDTTKNKANWKVGRIINPIVGKDGVTRGYKILTGSGYVIERPQQLVCDLEIAGVSNDSSSSDDNAGPSGDVQQQRPVVRARREARRAAADRLVGIMANENEED